jgi:hypothetical protein
MPACVAVGCTVVEFTPEGDAWKDESQGTEL